MDYEKLREEYRPRKTELLFISEAPPRAKPGDPPRFFYDNKTTSGDSLFLEMMSVLFLGLTSDTRAPSDTRLLRRNKETYLRKFQGYGFWLQDAIPWAIDKDKVNVHQAIWENRERMIVICQAYHIDRCVLITRPVFGIKECLQESGIKILNGGPLPFAGRGHQKDFRRELGSLLRQNGYQLPLT